MQWYFEYTRRLVGTALSFAVFGIGGLIYGLILFPLVFLTVRNPAARRRIARKMIGRGFGAFAGLMKFVGVMDYRVEGLEHYDANRRQLIIANHPTLIDVVLLIALFPQVNCVIKEAVRRNFFMGSTVRAADYISNNEPDELLDSCIDYLSDGKGLLLFPEGTRTRRGEAIAFKQGAATVALKADADILPVVIDCRPLFLSKQLPWHFVPRGKPMFTIRVLPPRAVRALVQEKNDLRRARHELNETLLALVNSELAKMAFSQEPS